MSGGDAVVSLIGSGSAPAMQAARALLAGNGVALWFEIDDFDAAVCRAEALNVEIALASHRNPPEGPGGPAHREIWLRDPDGYLVVLASPDGESPWPDPRLRDGRECRA